MKNLKTYRIRSNYSAEPSYAICVASPDDDAGFRGESFLIFHREDAAPELVAHRLSVDHEAGVDPTLQKGKKFFLAEAFWQAKTDYRQRIHRLAAAGPGTEGLLQHDISRISLKALGKRCRRQPALHEPLQRISALTAHPQLATVLQEMCAHPLRVRCEPLGVPVAVNDASPDPSSPLS